MANIDDEIASLETTYNELKSELVEHPNTMSYEKSLQILVKLNTLRQKRYNAQQK